MRVIARLGPGVVPADVAASYGSAVLGYVPEIRLALLRAPDGTTERGFVLRLQSDPRVEFAELDIQAQTAEARQSTIAFSEGCKSWPDVLDQSAFQRVQAGQAHLLCRGEGVLVAILDTGIDLDHPALASHLSLPGVEYGVTESPGDDRPEYVDSNGDGLIDGALGHGTHVAGIVLAMAPAAELLPVRVLDSDGVGYAFDIARGLVAAVNRGARIANLSLGMTEPSQSVAAAGDYARAAGVAIVAPAGNESSGTVEFPASAAGVIAVAGTDSLDHKAPFSNYGAPVAVAGPAIGILSTYVGGGYAAWSGTSMAAPFASGILALVYGPLGARSPTAAAVAETLLRSGAVSLAGVDPSYGSLLGAGRVNAAGSANALIGSRGSAVLGDPGDPPGLIRKR